MAITGFSHIGICVRDLEASVRFYRDVLGFQLVARMSGIDHPDVARLLELEKLAMELVFVERDGMRIELIRIASPTPSGGGKGPFNRVGFTQPAVPQTRERTAIRRVHHRRVRELGNHRADVALGLRETVGEMISRPAAAQ